MIPPERCVDPARIGVMPIGRCALQRSGAGLISALATQQGASQRGSRPPKRLPSCCHGAVFDFVAVLGEHLVLVGGRADDRVGPAHRPGGSLHPGTVGVMLPEWLGQLAHPAARPGARPCRCVFGLGDQHGAIPSDALHFLGPRQVPDFLDLSGALYDVLLTLLRLGGRRVGPQPCDELGVRLSPIGEPADTSGAA